LLDDELLCTMMSKTSFLVLLDNELLCVVMFSFDPPRLALLSY
jgi:hypothetical protein